MAAGKKKQDDRTVFQRLVDSRMHLIILLFLVVGVVALVVSENEKLKTDVTWLALVLGQTGGLLVATGALTIVWELLGKRAFADEVWSKAQLAGDLARAGIERVTDQYLEDVKWSELFRDARKIDIVVAYANTWRNTHGGRLEQACKEGARVRVFLPDPADTLTMQILANRFDITETEMIKKVTDAAAEFALIGATTKNPVSVFKRPGDLVFSGYRFGSRAVPTLYSHSQQRRASVPTFVTAEGTLFKFVLDDFDAIERQSTPW